VQPVLANDLHVLYDVYILCIPCRWSWLRKTTSRRKRDLWRRLRLEFIVLYYFTARPSVICTMMYYVLLLTIIITV